MTIVAEKRGVFLDPKFNYSANNEAHKLLEGDATMLDKQSLTMLCEGLQA